MASGRWASSRRRTQLPTDWPTIRRRILARDKWCTQCRAQLAREVDHIQPGGPHSDDNLRGLCAPCHRRKSAREGAEASTRRRRDQAAARHRPTEPHPGLIGDQP